MDRCFTSFPITERSFVAYAKREIHQMIVEGKFSDSRRGEIDIIVSELSSNLIKHGGGGELLVRVNPGLVDTSQFEILGLDSGPGIQDMTKMMKDGMSTSNSLGQGMGAMQRLSDQFQVFSIPGWGTIVYCRVATTREEGSSTLVSKLDVKALSVPKSHEVVCGDGYAVKKTRNDVQIFFGDGLGHGEHAHEAVESAASFFMKTEENDPITMIRLIHDHVRRSRGLVATIAILDFKSNSWKLGGVGNIMTRMYKGTEYRTHMSYNGTIGMNMPNTMSTSVIQAEKGQRLVMCSDGLRSSWNVFKYPTLARHDGIVQAAVLYKDFSRRIDDSSVLVGTVN